MILRAGLLAIVIVVIGCASHQNASNNKKNPAPAVTYTGGNGESLDSAIVIRGVQKKSEGVQAEFLYISRIHGEKDKSWRISSQTAAREENKIYDIIEIDLVASSEKRIYYFDVSKFPKNFKESKLEFKGY